VPLTLFTPILKGSLPQKLLFLGHVCAFKISSKGVGEKDTTPMGGRAARHPENREKKKSFRGETYEGGRVGSKT
jgi:hypothetical protein